MFREKRQCVMKKTCDMGSEGERKCLRNKNSDIESKSQNQKRLEVRHKKAQVTRTQWI